MSSNDSRINFDEIRAVTISLTWFIVVYLTMAAIVDSYN